MKFVNLLLVFILIAFVENVRLTKTIKQQQLGEELVISKAFDPKETVQMPTAVVETVTLDKDGNEISQELVAGN